MSSFIDELRQVNNIEKLSDLLGSDLCNAKQWHDFYISLPLVGLAYERNLELLNHTINEYTINTTVDSTLIIKELLRDFKSEHEMVLAKDISSGYTIKGYAEGTLLTYDGQYFKKYCNEIADQMNNIKTVD